MSTKLQRFRYLTPILQRLGHDRLVIITGARQTGKTTLARATFPQLRYVNLDAIEAREVVRGVRTDAWAATIGPAILDEAQKEPAVFDKVKFAFDAGQLGHTVLLGSSQILMLQRVRETLAGRAFVFELWPLMASELVRAADDPPAEMPLVDKMLTTSDSADALLGHLPTAVLDGTASRDLEAIEHLLTWGGMPALLELGEEARGKWLASYEASYLERDLGDLARLTDLMPFRQFQRLCALRTGQLVAYADLARDAGVSPHTARRYLEYLRLSYQAFLLPPYSTNLTSTLVKAPKVYWLDLGLWRQQVRYRGPVTGAMFETLVVTELYKWVRTHDRPVDLAFYRTRSGLEVDLLITTPEGVWGIEAKAARRLGRADWRGLRDVGAALGERWRGGLVVYRGTLMERLDEQIWAVPVERLFVGS